MAMNLQESIGCQSYGIFWDIENCPIPPMKRASEVIESIKKFVATNYESRVGERSEPCAFYCSCDTKSALLDKTHVEALNRSGVDILHVNPIRALNEQDRRSNTSAPSSSMSYKVDADSKLKECIQKYVDHHFNTKKCLLFVITGDIDFAPAIRGAKRRGFQVILLYGTNTSQEMKNCATESHAYNDIVDPTGQSARSYPISINRGQTHPQNTASMTNGLLSSPPKGLELFNSIPKSVQSNRQSSGAQSLRTNNESTVPAFVANVQNTVRGIENENKSKGRPKGIQQLEKFEISAEQIDQVKEIANVDRHVALRVLQSTNGNVSLAINLLVSD